MKISQLSQPGFQLFVFLGSFLCSSVLLCLGRSVLPECLRALSLSILVCLQLLETEILSWNLSLSFLLSYFQAFEWLPLNTYQAIELVSEFRFTLHWGLRIQICPSNPHTGLKSLLKILLISCLWRSFSFPASQPGRRAALYWYVFSPMKCSSLQLSLFRDSLKCHYFAEFRKTDFVPQLFCFVCYGESYAFSWLPTS